MYFKLKWKIEVGDYELGFLDSVEIHRSVDLLADTCSVKLPATINNKAIKADRINEIEGKIKRGDKVKVWLGYDKETFTNADVPEFEGYLLNINTDDGSIILNCEDDLFLMRKPVQDKQFKNTGLKEIAEYLVKETNSGLLLNCSFTLNYDKFVISKATGYDVLKKLQDECKGNIYIKKNAAGIGVLNIHPPYIEKHGYVEYSFQKNIEKSDLKYKSADDKRLQVEVENTGKDGKKVTVLSGTTGGDKVTIKGYGLSKAAMQQLADAEYRRRLYNGYEGSITTWLLPYVEPGYSAQITDEDYEFKDGIYYVTAVTTTMDGSGGGVRKVQLGIKLASNGQI
jgi:hypothetical protein